jgi:exopolyphosphatase/guanosine-5'-triphosphate,3'-diphosphate pyrophosphatase
MLAALVRSHRRKFSNQLFSEVSEDQRDTAMRLSILLRLAVLLHRTRAKRGDMAFQSVRASNSSLELTFPTGMLEQHPLTQADLEYERNCLKAADFEFTFD